MFTYSVNKKIEVVHFFLSGRSLRMAFQLRVPSHDRCDTPYPPNSGVLEVDVISVPKWFSVPVIITGVLAVGLLTAFIVLVSVSFSTTDNLNIRVGKVLNRTEHVQEMLATLNQLIQYENAYCTLQRDTVYTLCSSGFNDTAESCAKEAITYLKLCPFKATHRHSHKERIDIQ